MLQLPTADVGTLIQVIQQAVAPVFLLTGVGAILGVLVNRFGRVVDRFRKLEALNEVDKAPHLGEMKTLSRRAKWIHRAITLCTVCALLVCIVIMALFVGVEMAVNPARLIALLFVGAMGCLIAGLLCFLREIALASGYLALK